MKLQHPFIALSLLLSLQVPGSAEILGPVEITSAEETWTTSAEYACAEEAMIEQPVIAGADDDTILGKVQTAISFEAVWDVSLDELKADHESVGNMCGAGYEVAYNDHGLLSIDYWWESMGAYPSTAGAHRTVDTRTGEVLTAADCFTEEGLTAVMSMLTERVEADVLSQREIVAEDADAETLDWYDTLVDDREITSATLDTLGIEEDGIRIFYEIGFPHAIQAYEPCSSYLFTVADLETYIESEGPLHEWWESREHENGC